MRTTSTGLALFAFALVIGCGSGRGRVEAPELSPSAAASQAMDAFDTNKDGFLDATELEKCPSLKAALKAFDANGDGKLSADEIAGRLQKYREHNIALMSVSTRVYFNNHTMDGITVTLVPEAFMGPAFKKATGVSMPDGTVFFRTEGQKYDGVACGLYRIEVSKIDGSGKNMIAPKYNTQTTLGCEIGFDRTGIPDLKVSHQ